MRYDQLFTKLFCKPLCLEAGTRAGLERVLLAHMRGQPATLPEFNARKVDALEADHHADGILELSGELAVVHIDGAIDRQLSQIDRLCFDACDLNDVNRALARIERDDAVKDVLIVINSPGGTVNGVPETARRIADLATRKNVFAFIDGMGCSAAYWLAAACDQIFTTESSMVGSIGVYLAILDASANLEMFGLSIQTIQAGDLKTAGVDWKPLTDAERDHLQNTVDEINATFRGSVLTKRSLAEETMQGQAFFGASSLEAGLVDAIVRDRDGAIAQFATR